MIKAIIFDMDGVIFDTERFYFQATLECLNANGANIDYEQLGKENVFGRLLEDVWTILKDRYSLPEEVSYYTQWIKNRRTYLLETEGVHPMPGSIELIKRLKNNGYLIGLASSSPMIDIESNLAVHNLKPYFDVLLSGTTCNHSKPDPEIYITTAKKLSVAPSECLVFEDSTNGVLAAKAAGMTCYGYANPGAVKQDISRADKVINHFNSVLVPLTI